MKNVLFTVVAIVLVAGGALVGRFVPLERQVIQPTPAPTATVAPTATPIVITSAGVIRQIQRMSALEVTKYQIETFVEEVRPPKFGFGGETLLIFVHGQVVAGVDLGKLSIGDVEVGADGKTVAMNLPAVEILNNSLDETRTRVYKHEVGWFGKHDPNFDTIARVRGLAQILTSACEDGIVKQAGEDARQSMEGLLGVLGFERITVTIEDSPANICPAPTPAATPAS